MALPLTLLIASLGVTGCEEKLTSNAPVGCASQVTVASVPAKFPSGVPFPPGAVVSGFEERSGERLIVTAVAPGGFTSTLSFMQKAYPDAGLTLSAGEVEERDAESDFAGQGLKGRWSLREIPDCGGDTLVTVLVAKQ